MSQTSHLQTHGAAHAEDVTGLLLSVMDAIRGDAQRELPESCSLMHVKALDFIANSKSPSMSDIAEYLKITSPGATMVVDKLVENKELDRRADPDDRRVIRMDITTKGKATLEAGMKAIGKSLDLRLAVLNKQEQRELAGLLKKLVD